MPFKRWIKKYENDNSLLGDLARDIQNDDRFPERSQAYHVIYNYLVGMNACETALITFQKVWNRYEMEAK